MIYQQVNDLPEDLPEDHITTPGQRRSSRRQRTEMIYQQVNDLPEDLPEDHITTPGQRRSSRRQRTTNYKDQDDEDLNLVPGPLLQENIQELSSDDTVNMLRFLLS